MKKVAFYTLGCKLNYSETSTIARQFAERGFIKVDFHQKPDIFIINTCSVTDNADKKCRKLVREAQKISPHAFVAIVGCYAQLKPREIAEIPGVDAVLGASEKFQLLDLIGTFEKPRPASASEKPLPAQVYAQEVCHAQVFEAAHSWGDRTRTFLKVQDGCNYHCAFCTIPLARGRSRSDTIANVVRRVVEIVQTTETKEIVLTGVNTGDFGIQEGRRQERFVDLLKALDEVSGVARFRISSVEPNLLTREIIEMMAQSDKFVPHFHLPLQSGSDRILEIMRRRYRRDLYRTRVAQIKALMPQACIGVDVIVGFPTETEADFLDTYQFLQELDIAYLHVFTYSERANTAALELKPVVPAAIRHRRSQMLHILSEKKKRFFYEQQVGREMTVLFENDLENGWMHGFTENYVRVKARYDPMLINELKKIRITSITPDLKAEVEEVEVWA
ncbi:MAG: tRNA (N(6)-L-threonylcarbamoyladenosine(37)-C(2))-methylthiotransferase MtaB [Microscillaceae bacterium]